MTLYAVGFLWLRSAAPSFSTAAPTLAVYILGMTLFGFGQGLSGPPLLNIAVGFVDKDRAGMAGGIVSTVQQLGAAFGPAFADMIFGHFAALGADEPAPLRYTAAFSAAVWLNVAAMLVAIGLMTYAGPARARRLPDARPRARVAGWRSSAAWKHANRKPRCGSC